MKNYKDCNAEPNGIGPNSRFESRWQQIYGEALFLLYQDGGGLPEEGISSSNKKRAKKLFKLLQKGY